LIKFHKEEKYRGLSFPTLFGISLIAVVQVIALYKNCINKP